MTFLNIIVKSKSSPAMVFRTLMALLSRIIFGSLVRAKGIAGLFRWLDNCQKRTHQVVLTPELIPNTVEPSSDVNNKPYFDSKELNSSFGFAYTITGITGFSMNSERRKI